MTTEKLGSKDEATFPHFPFFPISERSWMGFFTVLLDKLASEL